MLAAVLLLATFVVCIECSHIFTIEKDFNKLHEDKELGVHSRALVRVEVDSRWIRMLVDILEYNTKLEKCEQVGAVLQRLKAFKVAVHPRIRLFYELLKRAMADYARRTSHTLYNPSTYRRESDNAA